MPTRKRTKTPALQPELFEVPDEIEVPDEKVARAARKRVRYFAYGSNADQEQMRARCPSARLLGTAVLRDHFLAFAGHSASRGGAVATVISCPGFAVHGALYSITRADLASLDRFEGVPWMYTRAEPWVRIDERRRRAVVYRLRDEQVAVGLRRPAPAYLGQIVLAYRHLGLPDDGISLALDIAARAAKRGRPRARPTATRPPLTSRDPDPTYASRPTDGGDEEPTT